MATAVEHYYPGETITLTAGGTITGGKLVAVTGTPGVVTEAGANSTAVVGVAKHDAVSGDVVSVARVGVWALVASGAITAGDRVKAGAAGVVVTLGADTDYSRIVGIALDSIADTALGRIALKLA